MKTLNLGTIVHRDGEIVDVIISDEDAVAVLIEVSDASGGIEQLAADLAGASDPRRVLIRAAHKTLRLLLNNPNFGVDGFLSRLVPRGIDLRFSVRDASALKYAPTFGSSQGN